MQRINPERIKGIKIRGEVTDVKENKWFTFDIRPKSRDLREELNEIKRRSQKLENGENKYFRGPHFKGIKIHIVYLNWESAKGLYKDPENNLPYEILDISGRFTIYRQSTVERKENIFNRLEELAIKEGLRNVD